MSRSGFVFELKQYYCLKQFQFQRLQNNRKYHDGVDEDASSGGVVRVEAVSDSMPHLFKRGLLLLFLLLLLVHTRLFLLLLLVVSGPSSVPSTFNRRANVYPYVILQRFVHFDRLKTLLKSRRHKPRGGREKSASVDLCNQMPVQPKTDDTSISHDFEKAAALIGQSIQR